MPGKYRDEFGILSSLCSIQVTHKINLTNNFKMGTLHRQSLSVQPNSMLARLQAAFERQHQFVADANHELRTPLIIVNLKNQPGAGSPPFAK